MTDKAQKMLRRMNKRKALQRWRGFSNPGRRDRILNELNREQLDDMGPFGGDQGMKVLQEMNELGQAQEQMIRESFAKISVPWTGYRAKSQILRMSHHHNAPAKSTPPVRISK